MLLWMKPQDHNCQGLQASWSYHTLWKTGACVNCLIQH